MQVMAGKFMGSTFCHELGSGQLCSPESLLYATVKKAEEAEQSQQELRAALAHAIAQQADLTSQLRAAKATIKVQSLALEQQTAVTVPSFAEIQAAGQQVSGVRATAWRAAGVHEICALDCLNPDAPVWLQSRIR